MDTLRFEIIDDQRPEAARIANPGNFRGLAYAINGTDLVELVRAVELPFAEREGHPEIAGDYGPLALNSVTGFTRYFMGEESGGADWPGWTVLLVCAACGTAACWPLLVKIEVSGATVRWHDFRQPHRGERSRAGEWTYDSFGPFVFDRRDYEAEVERLNSSLTPDELAVQARLGERQARADPIAANHKGDQRAIGDIGAHSPRRGCLARNDRGDHEHSRGLDR